MLKVPRNSYCGRMASGFFLSEEEIEELRSSLPVDPPEPGSLPF